MSYDKAKVVIDLDEYLELKQATQGLIRFIDGDLILARIKESFTKEKVKAEAVSQLMYTVGPEQRESISNIFADGGMNVRNGIINLITEELK